jgi:hypothetical protein
MKFSMTGQEKGDLLIQVTAWEVGLYLMQKLLFFRKSNSRRYTESSQ